MRIAPDEIDRLEETAYQIRRHSLEMITYGCWGHIGGAFSIAEILACLYFHELKIKPDAPDWPQRDRFLLSKAHASPGLYAALALRGFFPVDELYTYPFPAHLPSLPPSAPLTRSASALPTPNSTSRYPAPMWAYLPAAPGPRTIR